MVAVQLISRQAFVHNYLNTDRYAVGTYGFSRELGKVPTIGAKIDNL